MHTLTLTFATLTEVAEAVAKLTNTYALATLESTSITHEDRPDVGAPLRPVAAPAPVAANPFAAPEAAVVPVPPTPPAAPAVPVVPAPTEPSAATDPTDAPTSGEGLDSKGLPWDGRIHGSTKSKNADGSWRQKRGLNDDAMKVRVEAELRAAMSARAPTTAVVPPTPPADAPAAGETFGQLMARIAPRMGADPAYAEKLNDTLAKFGLMSLAGLASRGDLVGPFAATLDAATA